MKLISSRIHARLDYLVGLFAIASIWIFQLRESENAAWVMLLAGSAIIVMSIFTNYEGGLVRIIPIAGHLNVDLLLGAVVTASPWIFGFTPTVYQPHLIVGIFIIVSTLLSVREPYTDRSDNPDEKKAEDLKRSTPVDSKLTD